MRVIEPHVHMIARTTQDYERMSLMHCVACCEPAFWAGYDRTSPAAFHDYFTHLTEFEPSRAAQYGIKHYCWICINPKEADDVAFSKEVISFMPEFLDRPNVLGVGEIGLNKNTKNELEVFELQVDLAMSRGDLIWIHTPHLDDKMKGVRLLLDSLKARGDVPPEKVCFDHMEEHVLRDVLDQGYWAALTVYPQTKNSPSRIIDSVERFGLDRLIVDASGDWGPSDPATLHHTIREMRRRGHDEKNIERLFFDNPCDYLEQCPKFQCR